ncbi:phenylalanine--tRNA ligase beta subunit-related protein [Deinococcus aestuarii]|uniref:phenylalanine--tRNA ligase beta subunit-related protein n=1 Tax=Deinococcus aestuarii TaxID=2774531 RepID=UPI001C0B984F|nr:phenylalanine--tRNA ligase beta subunit-related protein [Deinococcus aestuarii]
MLEIEVTDRWHTTFPGAHVGVLLIGGVDNSAPAPALDRRKREVEARLREQFGGLSRAELLELEVLKAYRDYYRKFDQTYHVQLQLESVVHRGKALPTVSPLVDASFVAELETLVLTASHDADRLEAPVTIDATRGGKAFTQMSGKVRSLKPGDMMMGDGRGVVCTILSGQDARTPVSPGTRRALYVTYAPAGVPEATIWRQLDAIRENVLLFAPHAGVELVDVYASPRPGPALQ